MENNDYPVLCGSTFFSLLVDYLKPAHSVRDRYAGRSSITNPDMLAGLLQIIDSGFVKPADKAKDSFKTLTANYKSGLKDERTFLHEEQLKKFDINVGDNYYQYLKKMSLYLDYIIPKDANNEYEIAQIKLKPLVISLIKLIEDDRSIDSEFSEMAEEKTAIFITHRLGSTMITDRILVIADGKIAQNGSHSALIEQGGIYAEMWKVQKQWYIKNEKEAEILC